MSQVTLTVNGERTEALVEPRTHLGDFLRETCRLTGTHLGCEHGVCGACTILIDGKPSRSCITYAVQCEGLDVRTIEGFDDDPLMRELRAAFTREHALQCGFCTPGMLISARDIVQRCPDADERRIRIELSGNLCRCTGYMGIVSAVQSVIEARRSSVPSTGAMDPKTEPAAWRSFGPSEAANTGPAVALAAVATASSATRSSPLPGWNRIEQSFIAEQSPAVVWNAFADMPMVASCLPGAEIESSTADQVKGKINVKFGPMTAGFSGEAALERNDATMTGTIRGGGTDSMSNSRAKSDIVYRLSALDDGRRTNVAIVMDFNLQGPLAQFSRAGIVTDFANRMVQDFARNLNATLAGSGTPQASAPAPAQLDAGGFFWTWLWSRIKRIFGG